MSTEAEPLFFDVATYLADGMPEPLEPEFAACSDGVSLFYAGKNNTIFGEPESGKTWVALAALVETMSNNQLAVFLDLDLNGPDELLPRLAMLGASPEQLKDPTKFLYVQPEDLEHLRKIIDRLVQIQPAIVIIDSVGEVLPLYGASSNSPDDFTRVNRETAHRLAQAGACVITIDHVAKNADSRAYGSTGTAAKKRTISGSYIRATIENQFAPGYGGSCKLTILKDRPGGLRRHRPHGDKEPLAAYFHLHADGPRPWHLQAPGEGERNPTEVPSPEDQTAIMALEEWPVTVKRAREILGGRMERVSRMVAWRKAQELNITPLPGNSPVMGNDRVTHYPPPMSVTGNRGSAPSGSVTEGTEGTEGTPLYRDSDKWIDCANCHTPTEAHALVSDFCARCAPREGSAA